MKPRFPAKLLHPLCLIGGTIALVGFGATIVSLVIDVHQSDASAYQGLLTFILFPSVLFFGLCVLGVGLALEWRRARNLERVHEEWTPRLDPARRRHRRILFGLAVGALLMVAGSIVLAFQAFEFTETNAFCGELCHTPMEPQYTAHRFSPHANVDCTSCHVEPGLGGYVEAKVSGLRQLYAMFGATYPRPVRMSHEKLLVAAGSCEEHHRADALVGATFDSRTRFGYDLKNSARSLQLLLKPSGSATFRHPEQGFHWHLDVEGGIGFRATDEGRQQIPWVRAQQPDGSVVIYEDVEWKESGGDIAQLLPAQHLDCIDCHNRPAHRFASPDASLDGALASETIDASLPFIKKVSVAALATEYQAKDEAFFGIRREIEAYYRDTFQDVVVERRESLDNAIREVQQIYARTVFPSMKVNWATYADNSAHRTAPGCFRCHSGRHQSEDGQVIAYECNVCHVFLEKARDSESLVEIPADGSSFHPFRHEAHGELQCWSCHSDSASPYARCVECHQSAVGGHDMRFECSICHKPGGTSVTSATCAPCHPAGESTLHAHAAHRDCLGCHRPHDWSVPLVESCARCHEDRGEGYADEHAAAFRGVVSHMYGLPVNKR